mmetsp:Transcript_21909/g.35220  ORF Transcript_21909/g.35220 Transcript_21909/m.35220 type:complete len:360 (-) Transcript_21909:152-1231(-)
MHLFHRLGFAAAGFASFSCFRRFDVGRVGRALFQHFTTRRCHRDRRALGFARALLGSTRFILWNGRQFLICARWTQYVDRRLCTRSTLEVFHGRKLERIIVSIIVQRRERRVCCVPRRVFTIAVAIAVAYRRRYLNALRFHWFPFAFIVCVVFLSGSISSSRGRGLLCAWIAICTGTNIQRRHWLRCNDSLTLQHIFLHRLVEIFLILHFLRPRHWLNTKICVRVLRFFMHVAYSTQIDDLDLIVAHILALLGAAQQKEIRLVPVVIEIRSDDDVQRKGVPFLPIGVGAGSQVVVRQVRRHGLHRALPRHHRVTNRQRWAVKCEQLHRLFGLGHWTYGRRWCYRRVNTQLIVCEMGVRQ